MSHIFLIVLDTYFQGSLYSDPNFSSLDMDFFEPVGDKDWMVNLGVGSYIYLEYTSGKLATQCLGFLLSLVCLVAKGKKPNLVSFFWAMIYFVMINENMKSLNKNNELNFNIVLSVDLPVVPHKAVAEVSK